MFRSPSPTPRADGPTRCKGAVYWCPHCAQSFRRRDKDNVAIIIARGKEEEQQRSRLDAKEFSVYRSHVTLI
jgi:hypothetical protein